MPDWYPEIEAEKHGLTPDTWHTQGCYVLSLKPPESLDAFRSAWTREYEPAPPPALSEAITHGTPVAYCGWANSLLDRLHDHAAGAPRSVRLLRVLPPTGVAAVYPGVDGVGERGVAIAYRRKHEVCVWSDGEVV